MENCWDNIADIRRRQIENDKDVTFLHLFVPYFIDIFSKYPHQSILEIGCGTGHMANLICRNLSPDKYISIEESKEMCRIANEINSHASINIINESIFKYAEISKYDIIFSHLCLHTIIDLKNIFIKVYNLIKDNGIFVFSVPHPCFYNDYKNIFDNFKYMEIRNGFFKLSITNDDCKTGPIPYIHRPLEFYFKTLISNSFNIIDFTEIFPDTDIMKLYKVPFDYPHYVVFTCKIVK